MKKINFTKSFLVLFVFSTSLFINSCEEAKEILEDIQLFSFDYVYLPNNTSATVARNMAEQQTVPVGSTTFIQEDVPTSPDKSISNTVKLFGDPTTSMSQLLIRMERHGSQDHRFVRFVTIDLVGPFSVGQVYNSASDRFIELLNGPTVGSSWTTYSTRAITNTYFTLEITEFDSVLKRIGGTFHGYARLTDHPADSAAMLIHDGAFTARYRTQ